MAHKENACNAWDLDSIPRLGRSPGGGYGNPLQYACLENPMDRGAWWAVVHGVTKSWTQLRLSSVRKNVRLKCDLSFSIMIRHSIMDEQMGRVLKVLPYIKNTRTGTIFIRNILRCYWWNMSDSKFKVGRGLCVWLEVQILKNASSVVLDTLWK